MTPLRSLCATLLAIVLSCGGGSPTSPSTETTTPPPQNNPPADARGCARTSVGIAPLDDLGSGSYKGEQGGLYPGGSRVMPAAHFAAGLASARAIGPLDAEGKPAANGRYVLTSIGMSNTTQEFSTFKPLADADASKDPHLTVVDGAQGGVTASQWISPACPCWATLDGRLRASGVSPKQVVAAWVKLADASPTESWPGYARRLYTETITVLQNAKSRYPNLQLAYLTSRIYGGYATSALNPEPYAFESGFSVKWTIADQINGSADLQYEPVGFARAPWIAWGPYMWADGLTPRSDGLTWACSDLQSSDGTHPSTSGRQKVAQALLSFLKTDPTAREWFVR